MRLPFALTLAALVVAPQLRAANYYLGSAASSQGGIAVADLAALNAITLRPGDHVYLQGGETFSGNLYFGSDDSGTATAPVVITSFGTGRACISSGTQDAITIYNASGFAISDIDLVGSGSATCSGDGIDAGAYLATSTKLPYLRFARMNISGFKNGVELWAWYTGSTIAWPGFTDVQITAIDAVNNRSEGIKTWGTWKQNNGTPQYSHGNVVIAHCTAAGNQGDPASTSHTGSGIIMSGVDQGRIEYCAAHDNGGYGPTTGGGPYGIWAWESRGVTLQYNLVYNQKSSSNLDGGGYDLDGGCSGCTVQYNYSRNNQGPGLAVIQFSGASPLVNNTVRYNISENDCRKNSMGIIYVGQFSATYGVNGADIFGNTIFVSTNPAGGRPAAASVQNQSNLTGVRLRNNIFYATHTGSLITGAVNIPAKALYQGNDYWGGTFDLNTFRSGGQESLLGLPVGRRVDPQLNSPGNGGAVTDPTLLPSISAYWLKSTSPLIQGGLDLLADFGLNPGSHDFYGVAIASLTLDVGAAASTASTSTTTNNTTTTSTATTTPSSGSASTGTLAVSDDFSGTGSLAGRTPDTLGSPATWSVETGTGTIANGLASANISLRATIPCGASDGTVASTIVFGTTSTGLIVRSSDSLNYLRVMLTTSAIQLYRTQAGTTTLVASVARPFTLGQTYAMAVVLSGSSVTVQIDGATAASFSSTFNETATRHGLLASGSGIRSWANFSFQH